MPSAHKRVNPLSGRFNGTLQSDEGPIQVRKGFAIVDKELFLVSDDGTLVTNKDGGVVAIVSKGRLKPITPEIVNQLRSRGIVK